MEFVGGGNTPIFAPPRHYQYAHPIAERVKELSEPMQFQPATGGWVPVNPDAYRPPDYHGNLNVRAAPKPYEVSEAGYQFKEYRLPQDGNTSGESHYNVTDKSNETYAYSGARGIFSSAATPYIPAHYRTAAKNPPKPPMQPPELAPGTNVALKGGWPTQFTVGNSPSRHGWSIERAVQPGNSAAAHPNGGPSKTRIVASA